MSERLIVVDLEQVSFEGVFDAKGVVATMKDWAFDAGYFIIEKKHGESVTQEGKWVDMDMEAIKKLTDYAKSIVKIRLQFQDVKDIVVERDGKKVKVQEGKVELTLSGVLETDYEGRWESKPLFYVMRTIFEKYVLTPFVHGYERTVRHDLMLLKDNVKSYLNLAKDA